MLIIQVWMYDGDDMVNAQLANMQDLDREILRLLNRCYSSIIHMQTFSKVPHKR